jgi:hypothetical protein
MWIAQVVQQPQNTVECQIDLLGMQRKHALQDGGAAKGGCVVLDAHSAALATGGAVSAGTRVAVAVTMFGTADGFDRGRARFIIR